MPALASLAEFRQAVADFPVEELEVAAEPAAQAAAERSLAESGFLLLGEVHGVRENPLIIAALLREFGLAGLALEWPDGLAPVLSAFLAGEGLADHPLLWADDGRITAGHLAVLRELAAAGPLELTLIDGLMDTGWSWSQRDEAMARRVLAAPAAAPGTRATRTPRSSPPRWARSWPPAGPVSTRSGSTTAAAVTATSRRAGSGRAPVPVPSAQRSFSATKPHLHAPRRHRSGRAAAPRAAGPPLTGGSGGAGATRGGVAGSPGCAG
jgi:hypothetical protein